MENSEDGVIHIEHEEEEQNATNSIDNNDSGNVRNLGRSKSNIWACFTNTENPQKLKSVKCKHCKILVNHHKKSEYARNH